MITVDSYIRNIGSYSKSLYEDTFSPWPDTFYRESLNNNSNSNIKSDCDKTHKLKEIWNNNVSITMNH